MSDVLYCVLQRRNGEYDVALAGEDESDRSLDYKAGTSEVIGSEPPVLCSWVMASSSEEALEIAQKMAIERHWLAN